MKNLFINHSEYSLIALRALTYVHFTFGVLTCVYLQIALVKPLDKQTIRTQPQRRTNPIHHIISPTRRTLLRADLVSRLSKHGTATPPRIFVDDDEAAGCPQCPLGMQKGWE